MPPAGSSRAAGAATAPDRRQSQRQGRTSVTRPTNYYARPFAGRMSQMGGLEQTPPAANANPGFVPALTHFSQAVDAFPKELIKHFSLFKEVEAKTHDPEREMKRLLDQIAQLPVPTVAARQAAAESQARGDESVAGSVSSGMAMDAPSRHQQLSESLFPPEDQFNSLSPEEQADLKRRRLFFQVRNVMQSMLPALEEKLVVLTSAKATKDKALARMNHSFAQLDDEISPESRYGSLTHWAYADKEEKKKGDTARSRREVANANNLAAAAQHVHDADSFAAKSEARREAVQANRRGKNQHVDSDFDDRPVKKTQKRKVPAAETAGNTPVGLGITNTAGATQSKRKKTEKALAAATAAAPPMERSLSGAIRSAAQGGQGVTSPRATPVAEGTTKRKPRAAPAPAQRKRAVPAPSPPPASSPLASTFAINKATAGTSDRPTSSRARKDSNAASVTSAAQEPATAPRPSTSQSIQQAPTSDAITELEQAAGTVRDSAPTKDAPTPKETADTPIQADSAPLKQEEQEAQEPEPMDVDPPPAPVSTARSGRTSKTATPVVGAAPEAPSMARSRSTRNANNGNGTSQTSSENNSNAGSEAPKRGHKKNSQSTTTVAPPAPAAKAVKEAVPSAPPSTTSSAAPEPEYSDAGEEVDEDRYCYCNEVSYGSMIACDNKTCSREWFHLACVNMDKVPNARTKWYCSERCREAATRGGPKSKGGGRPGSSRQ